MHQEKPPIPENLPKWLHDDGNANIILEIVIQANAKKTAFNGEHDGCLRLKVAAPPVDGAANEKIVDFLAKYFSVQKRNVIFKRGEFARRKLISIAGIDVQTALLKLLTP